MPKATKGIMAEAAEDDPGLTPENRKILITPGLGYSFAIDDFAELSHQVWEWQLNTSLQM